MISFFYEDVDFKVNKPLKTKQWLKQAIVTEGYKEGGVNYIFCSDDYLLQMNQDHLDHDFYTDIITFDNSEVEGVVEGDLFISIDRIIENADNQGIDFKNELLRVMIHGILHLTGHKDKSEAENIAMRSSEDHYLSTLTF